MRRWQFDVLWGIAAAGSVFLLFSKSLGIEVDPTALTGFGAILTFVLTQRGSWTRDGQNGDGGKPKPRRRYTIWDRLGRIFEDPPDPPDPPDRPPAKDSGA